MKYDLADKELREQLHAVLETFHPVLKEIRDRKKDRKGLTFDILLVHPDDGEDGQPLDVAPLTKDGYPAQAVISQTKLKDRVLGHADILLEIDAPNWDKLTEKEQDALLDHELAHLLPKTLKDGGHKFDDADRPLFKMRMHDYQFGWFREVAARHGAASPEVKQAKQIYDETGQTFFVFLDAPKLQSVAA